MDGLIVVDKPVGPTSHDVVARMRRVLGESRIGHTGTLDPLASGVLALVVGRATRLAQFMSGDTKAYEAHVQLGIDTDTYDADGTPVGLRFAGAWPDRETVLEAIAALTGTHLQRPPAFSAKRIGGRRSYALARRRSDRSDQGRTEHAANAAVAEAAPVPAPVEVTLGRCEVGGYADGVVELSLECSSGFYVRSLAYDLGERLGTGAHLVALRRTRSGMATVAQAIPLADLESSRERAIAALLPMSAMLPSLPARVLTEGGVERISHGGAVGAADFAQPTPGDGPDGCGPAAGGAEGGKAGSAPAVRLLSADGALLAIAQPTSRPGVLHPFVVLM
jgi:tRNA pseudouridine55 synthase